MAVPSERTAIIDKFGELDRKVREFKPFADQHEKLKKQIQAWYDGEPADSSHVAEGASYSVQISARGNERTITNILKVYRLLGLQIFLDHCSIPLKHIDKLIDPGKHALFLTEAQTGTRRLIAVAKARLAA